MANELFSRKVRAGEGRTYFFDVKESADGTKYLTINESRRIGKRYKHERVMVFQDHFAAFNDGLNEAIEFMLK